MPQSLSCIIVHATFSTKQRHPFLTEITAGVNPDDHELAQRLRGMKTPVYIVVNKADNPQRETFAGEFYELGFEHVFPISSLHGRGVADLRAKQSRKEVTSEPVSLRGDLRLSGLFSPRSLSLLGGYSHGGNQLEEESSRSNQLSHKRWRFPKLRADH